MTTRKCSELIPKKLGIVRQWQVATMTTRNTVYSLFEKSKNKLIINELYKLKIKVNLLKN